MNILFVCGKDPNRIECGGDVRTHLLLEALRKVGDVYVACLDQSVREELGVRAVQMNAKGRVRAWLDRVGWAACEYLFSCFCPKILPFPFDLPLETVFPGVRFDAIVVRYPHLAAITRPWRYGRVFLDVDDDPVQMYDTVVATEHLPIRRWVTRKAIRMGLRFLLKHCVGAWMSNPEDVAQFNGRYNVRVLANIPLPAARVEKEEEKERARALLTVGGLSGVANYRGIESFLEDVWPQVRRVYPNLEYWLAGKGLDHEREDRWMKIPGVRCLGFVSDVASLYAKVLATVVPIEIGGGSCIKTRETLVHGRSCLTTAFGARGFPADDLLNDDTGLLVYHSSEEFLAHLRRVLDPAVREQLERKALRYAQSKLTFDNFVTQVEQMVG